MTNKETGEPGAIVGREETTSATSGVFYHFLQWRWQQHGGDVSNGSRLAAHFKLSASRTGQNFGEPSTTEQTLLQSALAYRRRMSVARTWNNTWNMVCCGYRWCRTRQGQLYINQKSLSRPILFNLSVSTPVEEVVVDFNIQLKRS